MGGGKRRLYLFRVEPTGLLAIRVGTPFAWFVLVGSVLGFFILLGPTAVGPVGSVLAGGAVGFATLGYTNRVIARAVASRPRDWILRQTMSVFLPGEELAAARIRETSRYTTVNTSHEGTPLSIAIDSPRPLVLAPTIRLYRAARFPVGDRV